MYNTSTPCAHKQSNRRRPAIIIESVCNSSCSYFADKGETQHTHITYTLLFNHLSCVVVIISSASLLCACQLTERRFEIKTRRFAAHCWKTKNNRLCCWMKSENNEIALRAICGFAHGNLRRAMCILMSRASAWPSFVRSLPICIIYHIVLSELITLTSTVIRCAMIFFYSSRPSNFALCCAPHQDFNSSSEIKNSWNIL